MVECPEDQPGFPGQEELISKLQGFMERYEDEVSVCVVTSGGRNAVVV